MSNVIGMSRHRRSAPTQKRFQPSPEGVAYTTLLRVADRMGGYFQGLFSPFEISGQHYNVLRILRGAEPDGLPTLTIAERLIERAPGITRMIDRLEAKALVRRKRCEDDRRCVYCRLTEKGLRLLERLDEPVYQANRAVFRGLSEAELQRLTALLDKALAGVEED